MPPARERASSRAAYWVRVSAGRRGLAGPPAGVLQATRHPLGPGRRPGPAPPHDDDDQTGRQQRHHHRHQGQTAQGGRHVVQRRRPGTGRAERHGRRRVEILPPVAGEPHLDPGVGVVGVHLIEVGDRVEATGHVADGLTGGDVERAQHHGERGGDLLAEAGPVPEEEFVHGVGAGGQGRDVLRVVRVRADPVNERLHLVIGRRVVGGDGAGQREHARVGVGKLHFLPRDVRGERERAVVRPQLRRRGGAHLRIDRVDGSGAQTDGRDDRAVAGDVDLAGGEPQLLRALGVEHEVGRRARDVEGLEIALPEGHAPDGDGQVER